MIENLEIILSLLQEKNVKIDEITLKKCATSLESAIEILKKLRN